MTTPPTGLYADLTLDGRNITLALDTLEPIRRQKKTIREAGRGGRREHAVYAGAPALPIYVIKHEVRVAYAHIRSEEDRQAIDWIVATPPPHTLTWWKYVALVYACDGTRREFELPWVQAGDALTPPHGIPRETFDPRVRVGSITATLKTPLRKSEEDYEADDPASGEVWFVEGGTSFKLATAPIVGSRLYVAAVPLIEVVEEGVASPRYQSNQREPRELVFLEM